MLSHEKVLSRAVVALTTQRVVIIGEYIVFLQLTFFSNNLLHSLTNLTSANNFQEHFAELVVTAVLRLKGSGNLDYIQVGVLHASASIAPHLKHLITCFITDH